MNQAMSFRIKQWPLRFHLGTMKFFEILFKMKDSPLHKRNVAVFPTFSEQCNIGNFNIKVKIVKFDNIVELPTPLPRLSN